MLAAAIRLADFPLDPALPLAGEARSRSCGSTLELRLATDGEGRIERIGFRAQACAIGQAAASLFLAGAIGRSAGEVRDAREALAGWLGGDSPIPGWPGLELLAPARGYPARHGAILLAWDAALAALASPQAIR